MNSRNNILILERPIETYPSLYTRDMVCARRNFYCEYPTEEAERERVTGSWSLPYSQRLKYRESTIPPTPLTLLVNLAFLDCV